VPEAKSSIVGFSGLRIGDLPVVLVNQARKGILNRLDHIVMIDQDRLALVVVDDRQLQRNFYRRLAGPKLCGLSPYVLLPLAQLPGIAGLLGERRALDEEFKWNHRIQSELNAELRVPESESWRTRAGVDPRPTRSPHVTLGK